VTVAEAAADYLRTAGVQRVYGVPGEDHLRLLDACEAAGLRYVAARDESAACIMAAAEAQATGRPGVVVVTLAPGLSNAINGLACAALDNLPLLVISGQHHPDRFPIIVRQALDNHALVGGVTKWRTTAGARIHQVLAKALDTALAPPAGPVFLELRDDVARAAPTDSAADWPLLLPSGSQRADVLPSERLRRLADALRAAERPAIIIGARAGAPEVERLSTALRAPTFTSPAAKGVCHSDDPWFAGTFLNGNLEANILDRADLVLAIGLDALDFFNVPWRYTAAVHAVEPDATNTQHFLPTRSQLVGNVGGVLDALVEQLGEVRSEWAPSDVSAYRAELGRLFPADDARLTIPTALAELRSGLPPETLLTVDAGFAKPLTSYLWPACAPNTCFTAHGLSTMGYAIPAANALTLVFPERPVLALMGDGSLLMRAPEIGVAAAFGSAPIYVAWIDASLSQIEIKQRRQGLRPVGATFPPPCCPKIADAFGALGWDVDTRAALRAALDQARMARQPSLIGVRVDHTSRDAWFDLLRG
jgi:acetolactate synthase-1/2/3 large subunit